MRGACNYTKNRDVVGVRCICQAVNFKLPNY